MQKRLQAVHPFPSVPVGIWGLAHTNATTNNYGAPAPLYPAALCSSKIPLSCQSAQQIVVRHHHSPHLGLRTKR